MEFSSRVETKRFLTLTMNEQEAKQLRDLLDRISLLDVHAYENCRTPPFEDFNDLTFKLKMELIKHKI